MSDHWNTLANLLGTPSIDPLQRKPSNDIKPQPVSSTPSPEPAVATKADLVSKALADSVDPKPVDKPEPPSRIRASWDAVARIFGVAAPVEAPESNEQTVAPEATPAASSATNVFDDLFAGFRGKPSKARGATEGKESKSIEPDSVSSAERREPPKREPSGRDRKDDRRPAAKKRAPSWWDSSEGSETTNRDEVRPELAKSKIADEPTSLEPVKIHEVGDEPSERSNDRTPDRRGPRRRIRRGRSEQTSETETSLDNEPTRSHPPSDEESPVSNRHRSDRRSRPERAPRPTAEREPRGETTHRERRPESFGRPRNDDFEVVSDNWAEVDEAETTDELIETAPSAEPSDEADGQRRRRRRRGRRGRKPTDGSRETDENLDDISFGRQAYGQHMAEEDEDGDADTRITKITPWLEAIRSMIDSNIENHRRSPSHEHRHRGNSRPPSRRRNNDRSDR